MLMSGSGLLEVEFLVAGTGVPETHKLTAPINSLYSILATAYGSRRTSDNVSCILSGRFTYRGINFILYVVVDLSNQAHMSSSPSGRDMKITSTKWSKKNFVVNLKLELAYIDICGSIY